MTYASIAGSGQCSQQESEGAGDGRVNSALCYPLNTLCFLAFLQRCVLQRLIIILSHRSVTKVGSSTCEKRGWDCWEQNKKAEKKNQTSECSQTSYGWGWSWKSFISTGWHNQRRQSYSFFLNSSICFPNFFLCYPMIPLLVPHHWYVYSLPGNQQVRKWDSDIVSGNISD